MSEATTAITTQPRRFQCRHIFTGGHRCGSPCLRHEDFCFYHHTAYRRRATPTCDLSQGEHQSAPFTLPNPEDRGAIQVAIGDILSRLAANELDPRRAGLMLYGLQIASINLPPLRARPTPAPEQPLIEEVVTDPVLGTLALRTELPDPNAPRSKSLLAQIIEEFRCSPRYVPPATELDPSIEPWTVSAIDPIADTQPEPALDAQPRPAEASTPQPETSAQTPPEPATLPTLTAAAAPSPHRVCRNRTRPAPPSISLAILTTDAQDTPRPRHPRRLGLPPRDRRQRHRPRPHPDL